MRSSWNEMPGLQARIRSRGRGLYCLCRISFVYLVYNRFPASFLRLTVTAQLILQHLMRFHCVLYLHAHLISGRQGPIAYSSQTVPSHSQPQVAAAKELAYFPMPQRSTQSKAWLDVRKSLARLCLFSSLNCRCNHQWAVQASTLSKGLTIDG